MTEETQIIEPIAPVVEEVVAPVPDAGKKRRRRKAKKAKAAAPKVKKSKKKKSKRMILKQKRRRAFNKRMRGGKTIAQCVFSAMQAKHAGGMGGRKGVTVRAIRKQLAKKRIYVALFVLKKVLLNMVVKGVVKVMVNKRRLKLTGKKLPKPQLPYFQKVALAKKRAAARAAKKAAAARAAKRAARAAKKAAAKAKKAKKSRKARKASKKSKAKKVKKVSKKASKPKKAKKARKAKKSKKARKTKKLNSRTTIRSLIKMVRPGRK